MMLNNILTCINQATDEMPLLKSNTHELGITCEWHLAAADEAHAASDTAVERQTPFCCCSLLQGGRAEVLVLLKRLSEPHVFHTTVAHHCTGADPLHAGVTYLYTAGV